MQYRIKILNYPFEGIDKHYTNRIYEDINLAHLDAMRAEQTKYRQFYSYVVEELTSPMKHINIDWVSSSYKVYHPYYDDTVKDWRLKE